MIAYTTRQHVCALCIHACLHVCMSACLHAYMCACLHACVTFSELRHQLQPSGRPEVDAGPVHVIAVEHRVGLCLARPLRDVADLHRASGELEAVQLLQRLLRVLRAVELGGETRGGHMTATAAHGGARRHATARVNTHDGNGGTRQWQRASTHVNVSACQHTSTHDSMSTENTRKQCQHVNSQHTTSTCRASTHDVNMQGVNT